MRVPDEDRASAEESVPEEEASVRLRLRLGVLCLRSNPGGRRSIVDLLVLQGYCLVVLLLLLRR